MVMHINEAIEKLEENIEAFDCENCEWQTPLETSYCRACLSSRMAVLALNDQFKRMVNTPLTLQELKINEYVYVQSQSGDVVMGILSYIEKPSKFKFKHIIEFQVGKEKYSCYFEEVYVYKYNPLEVPE